MGAWGYRSFENDDALDFMAEITSCDGIARLDEILVQVAGAIGADAVISCKALAAAEIVAAQCGHPATDLPQEIRAWVAGHPGAVDPQLVRDAVVAVLTDSELLALWKEADEYRKWRSNALNLLKRVGGELPVAKSGIPRPKSPKPCRDHSGVPPIDTRGRKILLDYFWGKKGFETSIEPAPLVTTDDERYALAAGFFIHPQKLTHDEVINWAWQSVMSVQRIAVSNAFLASLTSHRLELRSALGSYAAGRRLTPHRYNNANNFNCNLCGLFKDGQDRYEFSVWNFCRYKWGGGENTHPAYIAFDLTEFSKLPACKPSEEDIAVFRQIIAIASAFPAKARPGALVKELQGVFPTNKVESEILLTIFGYCGILQPPDLPSFADQFVFYAYRNRIKETDWDYPISEWRGAHGVNQRALAFYFPQIKV